MRRFSLVVVLSLCAISFCAHMLSAQQAHSPAAPTVAAPSAKTRPGVIHLDVLVKDSSGKPLRGLKAQNFTVSDNGQAQKPLSFNPVDPRQNPQAVQVLIVVDMINIGFDSVAWAREQLGVYLKQDGGKLGYPTSIAVLDERGLHMMSGSTLDGNVLQAEFQKMGTGLRLVNRSAGWAGRDELMQTSLQQFSQIIAVEQTHPGRKLVLFISPGWPMLPNQGSEEDLVGAQWSFNVDVRLTNEIRDAHTAVYDLDTFDLGGDDHPEEGAVDPFYYKSFLKPVTKPTEAQYPNLALGVFADHSGGRVMVNGRSIAGEINDAMQDAGYYYEITYPAPPPGQPNQYHGIDVRVDQPGATVQTTAGYYSNPKNVGPPAKKKKR